MEKTIGAFQARRNLGKLIEEAFYRKDSFIILRSGRRMAAIISIEEYERMRQLAKGQVFAFLQDTWEKNKDVPAAELERDVEQAIAMLHQKRPSPQSRARKKKQQPE